MRHVLLTILLAASAAASASSFPDYPFIYVQGNARQEVAPNVGKITFNVWVADLKAEPALARVQARSSELLAGLAKHGIEPADITSYSIEQTFEGANEYRNRDAGPPRYIVSRTFVVEVTKLDSWSTVLSQLVGRADVTSLSVSFDRTDRQAIEANLELKAALDARQQGQRLAQAFGRELGSVVAVSRIGFDSIPTVFGTDIERYEVRYRLKAPGMGMAELTVPSTVVVERSVNTLFKLK
jgi:uncharacterized protein YggE